MNNPPQQQPQSQSHPPHQSQSQPSQNQTQPHHAPSPPLRSLQTLSISPYPGDYRYNGVFGPPVPGQVPTQGWGSPTKRGSRSGIPTVSAVDRSIDLLSCTDSRRTGTIRHLETRPFHTLLRLNPTVATHHLLPCRRHPPPHPVPPLLLLIPILFSLLLHIPRSTHRRMDP